MIGILSMKYLHPWMRLERLPLTIYENHQLILEKSTPTDIMKFNGLSPTYISMMIYFPWAVIGGLFRPFIWEHFEWISLGIRVENLVLTLLVFLNLYKWRKTTLTPLVLCCVLFIITLSGFITLSTPNFGTLTRYKSLYLPYFVFIISIIPYQYIFLRQKAN